MWQVQGVHEYEGKLDYLVVLVVIVIAWEALFGVVVARQSLKENAFQEAVAASG